MTNRENFLSLLRRQGYERVPVEFVLCPHLQEVCRKELGAEDYEEYFGMPWRRVDDLRLKDQDVEKFRKFYDKKPLAEGADIDIWGVGHEKSPNSMHMTYMRHPMENMDTLEEIENYPFPDFASADGSHQPEQVKKIKERDLIALGDMQMTIWECAWYMRSMEELFCDMMMEDEKAEFLFDKVTELSMTRALSYAKAGVDVLFLGDDIGMQHTIMMSEELYTTWIQPRLKKIIDAVKAVNPDILIFYHSCGFIEPLIPHLIEAGIDVLNPIQSECMDFEEISQKVRGARFPSTERSARRRLCRKGTPQEVRGGRPGETWTLLEKREGFSWLRPICWSRRCLLRISWLMWMPAGPTESKQTILYAGRGFCRGDGEGMHPEKDTPEGKTGE